MCSRIPVRVTEVAMDQSTGDSIVFVEGDDQPKSLALCMGDRVKVGDYVVCRGGYVDDVYDSKTAENILAMYAEIAQSDLQEGVVTCHGRSFDQVCA